MLINCLRILAIVKPDLGNKGNTLLILKRVEDWGEFGEQECCSLNWAVSIIESIIFLSINYVMLLAKLIAKFLDNMIFK